MKVILYRRVSTLDQAEHGHSLAQQEQSMLDYCRARGWEVVASFEDAGKSGRSRAKRPGLEAALAAVCEHKGVLLVYSLSRLARSTRDAANILAQLKECGADLAIVDMAIDTSTPHGKLVFGIFATIAEFESDLIGERMKAVDKHRKAQMGYRTMGEQPAGWRLEGGRRVPVRAEQKILRKIDAVREAMPGASYAAMARELNRRKVPTIGELRDGKAGKWRRDNLRQLMLSMVLAKGSMEHA